MSISFDAAVDILAEGSGYRLAVPEFDIDIDIGLLALKLKLTREERDRLVLSQQGR